MESLHLVLLCSFLFVRAKDINKFYKKTFFPIYAVFQEKMLLAADISYLFKGVKNLASLTHSFCEPAPRQCGCPGEFVAPS